MESTERKHFNGTALKVYDRMLERVESRLKMLEEQTLDTLREEIQEAVEFEYEVEELTKEEVALLGAYLKRDLEHLLHFVEGTGEGVAEWLKTDLALIEQSLLELLFSIADKTRLDTLELDQKLHSTSSEYISGEVATAGTLRCLNCGHLVCLTETSHIKPCDACNSHYFERITRTRPPGPEQP